MTKHDKIFLAIQIILTALLAFALISMKNQKVATTTEHDRQPNAFYPYED